MTNNYEQRSQKAYDLAVDVFANAVVTILIFQWKVIKHLSKVTWKTLKFVAWSITKKNFWMGMLFTLPVTAFCVLLGLTISYFKPYNGTYFGFKNRVLSDKERWLIEQVQEYEKKKKEFNMLEGLKDGDKKAVVEYIKIKFGEQWKTAVAVFTAESGLTCNRYQNWLNKDNSVDHGVAQINSVHLWRVGGDEKKLLDCRTNIDVAYQIYKEQGFKPWVAYQNGAYEKFLSSL